MYWLGEYVNGISQTSQALLDNQVSEEEGSLIVNWDYVDQAFSKEVVEDIFKVYCKLLQQLSLDESHWNSTNFVSIPIEHENILKEANSTEQVFQDRELLLHELFEKTALSRGNDTAVVSPAKSLTYQEVRNRALSLASQLKSKSVEPNQLVALVMQKVVLVVRSVSLFVRDGNKWLPH